MSGNTNPNEQTEAALDSPSEGRSASTSQPTDVVRQRTPVPSALWSEDNLWSTLWSEDEIALAQLGILMRQDREAVARQRRESVARHREAASRFREAALRLSEADARDPITYAPDRGGMTSRKMRNKFQRTKINSVGDEPYSDGEND